MAVTPTTTLETPPTPTREAAALPQADPYRYGWRDVRRTSPEGHEEWVRVPLTREDILHPQVGDFRMHSYDHERFCVYLHNVLTAQLAGEPEAVVLHDVRVAWDDPDLKAHGPDIAVIFGVRERRNWSTFDEAEEGTRPTLIIEVTSPGTRSVDLVDKLDEYEQVGVALYVIVDTYQRKEKTARRLLGYQLTPDGYVVLAPDERGRLWLEPVGLWLGLRDNEVECYDKAGDVIGDYAHVMAVRVQAEARAAAEAQARAEAEERAAAEAQARAELEGRVRELEAELRRLRDEGT